MEKIKLFPLRMPYTMWKSLKMESAHREKSVNKIINEVVKKYQEESKK